MMLVFFMGVYFLLAVFIYVIYRVSKHILNGRNKQVSKSSSLDLKDLIKPINDRENISEVKSKKVEVRSIKRAILDSCIDFNVSIFECLKLSNKNKNLQDIEKKIDEEFNFDNEKIIKEFINNIDESKNYDYCKRLKSKFSFNQVYELKTLTSDEQLKRLRQLLNDEEYKILELYIDTHLEFILDDFINYLNELIRLNETTVTIYVGNEDESYDYLDKHIRTRIDKDIYRGIKIGYRGHIYDFSLSGRNL